MSVALVVAGLINSLILSVGSSLFLRNAQAAGLSPISEMEGAVYAVTAANNLISFNTVTPSAILRTVPITGLPQGETISGLDFRPRTGQLYGVSSASRVYTINTTTGAATATGAAFTPALSGGRIGVDFNPVPDRIRVVTDAEQNLRLNPDTGAVAGTDTPLVFAAGDANANANPNVVSVAYTNNFNAATSTTLFGIDSGLDILVRQGSAGGAPVSPNTGQLSTIGALGVNTTDQVGFDISAPGDVALASLTPQGQTTSSLYSINLTTGAATLVGPIGSTDIVRDIALVTRVETVFAVNANNQLLRFNNGTPGNVAAIAITGLQGGEQVLGIDFRPATGQLFALTSASRVYTLDPRTAAATAVGNAPLATPLNGTAFGFDFNPVPDRIRVVSDNEQNLRLNPATGGIAAVDTTLAYAAGDPNASANPNIVGAAYTNNVAGATTTSLFVIDSNLDTLALQGSAGGTPNSPNGGQMTTVGALGVNTSDQVGFDIAQQTGAAFASLTVQGAAASTLYAINTTTGAATAMGDIGGGAVIRDIAIATRVETVVAVTAGNMLVSFNSLTPGTVSAAVPITGLGAGENIVGIDFRPAGNQLFGMSSASRIYTINPATGAATPAGPAFTPALSGTAFGFDFNPVPDRIRVVSEADQNLRLNPNNGALAGTDTTLAFATGDPNASANPNVVAVAYTNNLAGTPSTTLFGIDSNLDILVRQGSPGGAPVSPNTGQLFTVGTLGVNTGNDAGFDISDCSGSGYLSLTAAGTTQSQFYTINLLNGAATLVGTIGVNDIVRDIAVGTVVTPSAQQAGFAGVNAASFVGDILSPDMITAAFGTFQTQTGQPVAATTTPLPTTLGGMRVSVNGTDAGLFFVSNGQINFAIPSNVPDGQAVFTVTNANGTTRSGSQLINRAKPGIFTLNAAGTGTAAGLTTFDGVNFLPLVNPDGTERPVDPGTAARPNFLVLFATGLRNTPAANPNDQNGVAEAVTATIQGQTATVTFAGAHPTFQSVDQLNIIIPPQLANAGQVTLQLTVNGQTSNSITFRVGGASPAVSGQPVSLGQTVNGALTADDQVMIGGGFRTYFFDAYTFTAQAGTPVAFDLRATAFDPAVVLYKRESDGKLTTVAADDDLGGMGDNNFVNDNALLLTVIQESRDYVLVVTSSEDNPSGRGNYTLRLIGGAIQNVAYGATINGQIAVTDLQTSAGDFLDAYSFAGVDGDRVQIQMNAPGFDSLLILNRNTGAVVAQDDDGGGGQNARITVTLPRTGIYVIVATPFAPNRTGAYTMTLTRQNNLGGQDDQVQIAQPNSDRSASFNRLEKGLYDEACLEQLLSRRILGRGTAR